MTVHFVLIGCMYCKRLKEIVLHSSDHIAIFSRAQTCHWWVCDSLSSSFIIQEIFLLQEPVTVTPKAKAKAKASPAKKAPAKKDSSSEEEDSDDDGKYLFAWMCNSILNLNKILLLCSDYD